jgi:hypothetical protein
MPVAEDLAYLRNPIWWAGMVTSESTKLCTSSADDSVVIVGEGSY